MSSFLSSRGRRIDEYPSVLARAWSNQLEDGFHATKNPEGVINLGTSENKLMYDVLSQKFQENVSHDVLKEHTQYCDFGGLPSFKKAVADFLNYYMKPAETIDPNNLLVQNGCATVVEALGTVLADPGDGILIPAPYYGGFNADLCQRAQVVPFPVYLSSKPGPGENGPFQLSVWRLEDALDKAKKQGVTIRGILLTNPNNPVGNIYSDELLQDCLDFAHKHKLHVIFDEIYMLSVFKKEYSFKSILSFKNIPDRERLHVIWGFSKDFGVSGFRCGVLHTWNKKVQSSLRWIAYFQSVPTPTQILLTNLIEDKDWINNVFLPANHQRLRECYQLVCDSFKEAKIPYIDIQAGLFVWADFREIMPSLTFEEELALFEKFIEHKVYITPAQAFFCDEPGWFRLVFATDPEELKLGMTRVLMCFEKLREEVANKKRLLEGKTPTESTGLEQNGASCRVLAGVASLDEAGDTLEDLARALRKQIQNSDWLQKNTAEKWTQENPDLAKVFMDLKDSE
ncbi:1-aminocyclopropane-1-carboxylate synthase-like protein 1 isoform X2 [Nematostella vectensis]|uniref:1-aminocyclopropane-1-carboxylate synthase-like protein 1 isoform X2 n=1 Tax=Nematostella vectensis TaxID=45351 RepID=UPI00139054EC|nr:1-aminocyclopropane-1-carboxylate synthase-like protein 1 isoform X2 [Nematostella vectensis]